MSEERYNYDENLALYKGETFLFHLNINDNSSVAYDVTNELLTLQAENARLVTLLEDVLHKLPHSREDIDFKTFKQYNDMTIALIRNTLSDTTPPATESARYVEYDAETSHDLLCPLCDKPMDFVQEMTDGDGDSGHVYGYEIIYCCTSHKVPMFLTRHVGYPDGDSATRTCLRCDGSGIKPPSFTTPEQDCIHCEGNGVVDVKKLKWSHNGKITTDELNANESD